MTKSESCSLWSTLSDVDATVCFIDCVDLEAIVNSYKKKINFLYGNSHESDWPSSIQTNPLLFYPSVLIVDSIQMRSYPEYY